MSLQIPLIQTLRAVLLLFTLIGIAQLPAMATDPPTRPTTLDLLKAEVDIAALQHPYLVFNATERDQLRKDIKTVPKSKSIYEEELAYANRDLFIKPDDEFCIPMFKSRLEAEYDEARRTLKQYEGKAERLAFIYQMTGEQKYADKAFEFARLVCSQDSWMMTAHQFQNIYRRVWPYNVKDDQVAFNFDLGSGSSAERMALVYDWLYEALTKAQRDKIRGALLENAVLRVRGNYEYQWWATAYKCNWSNVCHGRLGMAALALLKEDPHLLDVVSHSYNGIDSTLQNFGTRGGWAEGRSYWRMTVVEPLLFMHALKAVTNGKLNLFQHPNFKDNPATFPLYTLYANFGDGSGKVKGEVWELNKIAAETNDETASFYLNTFVKPAQRRTNHFEIIWKDPNVKSIAPSDKSIHFPSIDWAVMQSDFTSDTAFSITCKAGPNDDPHHGHKDNGQFIVSYQNHSFIRDLGLPSYDDYYFAADRWDYPEAATTGHNVIMVDNEEQAFAKYKDEPWATAYIGGTMSNFRSTASQVSVAMNLTKAYPGKALNSWQRSIVLEKPNLAIVVDKVQAMEGSEIRSRLHPAGKLSLKQDHYLIEHNGTSLAVIPLNQATNFQLEAGKHASLPRIKDKAVELIPYVDVLSKASEEGDLQGYLIFPFEEGINVDEVVKSIQLETNKDGSSQLSFSLDGKSFNYDFMSDREMFMLK